MAYVVIVDDSQPCLTTLALALEAAGHTVEAYADPLVALPKLICVPPHCIILNGRMPGMSGIDLFLRYREYSSRPVVFLSANAEAIADTLLTDGLSADDYIDKPYSQDLVLRIVDAAIRRHTTPKLLFR